MARVFTAALLCAGAVSLALVSPALPARSTPGPLQGCAYTEWDDAVGTVVVKLSSTGAGGAAGTVKFRGAGLNQTYPVKLKAGQGFLSFPVISSGTVVVTASLSTKPPRAKSFKFAVNINTQTSQNGCTPK